MLYPCKTGEYALAIKKAPEIEKATYRENKWLFNNGKAGQTDLCDHSTKHFPQEGIAQSLGCTSLERRSSRDLDNDVPM